MFQSVKGFYSALGVMLSLIALYLVLTRAAGATQILGAGTNFGATIFRTLQGR